MSAQKQKVRRLIRSSRIIQFEKENRFTGREVKTDFLREHTKIGGFAVQKKFFLDFGLIFWSYGGSGW